MADQILQGKVAIVTGASRNKGRAFAEMVGAEGASVAVHYNSPNAKAGAEETAKAFKAAGGDASVFQADLTKVKEVEQLFDNVLKKFGHLDILVNTVGMVLKKPFVEITEEEYDRMFAINAKAAFFCMREAAKKMRDNGRILNLGTSLLAAPRRGFTRPTRAAKPRWKISVARWQKNLDLAALRSIRCARDR